MSRAVTGAEQPASARAERAPLTARLLAGRLAALQGGAVTLVHRGTRATYGTPGADLAATVTVHDDAFFRRAITGGSLGAAESYIDGEWSCDDLTALLRIFTRNAAATDDLEPAGYTPVALARRGARWLRRNTRRGSRANIEAHYDLGNDFFELMLDETMTYSCGIFADRETTLAEASTAKLDRMCRKLGLGPGTHVLEIGTGWGSFALHAAARYGARVTSTTISPSQRDLARRRIAEAGLTDRITVLDQDYRDLSGTFDAVVSIEMIEAIGHRALPDFFRVCCSRVRPEGLVAIQAITMPDHRYEQYRREVDFIQRYIFPGCCVPSLAAMTSAMSRASDLRLVHLEEIGPHYAPTLRRWRQRFEDQRDAVLALGYDERFRRLWEYYLCYCEAGFAERYLGDVQMLCARPAARPVVPALDPIPTAPPA